jgi:hypothetical protein
MTFIPESDLPIAEKTMIVHDDALGIDRRLIEGQRVPPDLVDAYNAAVKPKTTRKKADEK